MPVVCSCSRAKRNRLASPLEVRRAQAQKMIRHRRVITNVWKMVVEDRKLHDILCSDWKLIAKSGNRKDGQRN